MEQISLFELTMPTVKISKPIRLIELFAGYGRNVAKSQQNSNEGK